VNRLDVQQFLDRVLEGISDLSDEVRDGLRRLAAQQGGDRPQVLKELFLKAQEDG
jgi:hypothetical protein